MKIKCDRCGETVDGIEIPGVGSGCFYRIKGTCWEDFKINEDEDIVCDTCMWKSEKYRNIYNEKNIWRDI